MLPIFDIFLQQQAHSHCIFVFLNGHFARLIWGVDVIKLTVGDMFCGAGIGAIGAKQAGFSVGAAQLYLPILAALTQE